MARSLTVTEGSGGMWILGVKIVIAGQQRLDRFQNHPLGQV